jgi:hypothetical protein
VRQVAGLIYDWIRKLCRRAVSSGVVSRFHGDVIAGEAAQPVLSPNNTTHTRQIRG